MAVLFYWEIKKPENEDQLPPNTLIFPSLMPLLFWIWMYTSSPAFRCTTVDWDPWFQVVESPEYVLTSAMPFFTICVSMSSVAWLIITTVKKYNPDTGDLKTLVTGSNPDPAFVITWSKRTIWLIPKFSWWFIMVALKATPLIVVAVVVPGISNLRSAIEMRYLT